MVVLQRHRLSFVLLVFLLPLRLVAAEAWELARVLQLLSDRLLLWFGLTRPLRLVSRQQGEILLVVDGWNLLFILLNTFLLVISEGVAVLNHRLRRLNLRLYLLLLLLSLRFSSGSFVLLLDCLLDLFFADGVLID